MTQSPAQKAAFQKMIAARKAKSGNTEAEAKVPVKAKTSSKTGKVLRNAAPGKMTVTAAKKSAGRIASRISNKKKNRTQVGFD